MEITPYFCISDPYHQLPVFFPNLFQNHPVYQKHVLIRGVYVNFFGTQKKCEKCVFSRSGVEINFSDVNIVTEVEHLHLQIFAP
jgi:hypothetical protein